MEYLRIVIVAVGVGTLLPIILYLNRKLSIKKESKMNKDDFVIYYSLVWILLSLILSLGITAILIYLNFFQDSISFEMNFLIMPIWLLLLLCTFALAREKKIVKNDSLTVTPVFGRTKVYSFQEIKKLVYKDWGNGSSTYKVYGEKKIFSVSSDTIGFGLFMERIKEKNIIIETIEEHKNSKRL